MVRGVTVLLRPLAFGLLLVLCGCRSDYPVAGIMAPQAPRATLVMSGSKFPNILLHVDEINRTLRYVTSAADLGLVRTYDFSGALVEKSCLPVFRRDGWMNSFSSTWGGAVSPNSDYIVYLAHQYPLDQEACDLVCLNVKTGARHVLVEKLAKEPQQLAWLAWISPSEITVARYESIPQQEQARLMIIDVPRANVRMDRACAGLRKFAVSRSRRYMAYWEAGESYSTGPIKILDLSSLKIVAATEPGNLATFGRLEWNTEDTQVAYIMDNQLRTFSLTAKRSQTLMSFEGLVDSSSEVALQGYANGKLYYRITDPKDHVVRLQCLDEATRTPLRFTNHPEGPFNAYVCGDGTIIYYKLGHEPLD